MWTLRQQQAASAKRLGACRAACRARISFAGMQLERGRRGVGDAGLQDGQEGQEGRSHHLLDAATNVVYRLFFEKILSET
jgi:hypothetical protein